MTPTKAAPTDAPTDLRERLDAVLRGWIKQRSIRLRRVFQQGDASTLIEALAAFLTTREAEIRRNALEEAANVAGITLVRSSGSVKEMRDNIVEAIRTLSQEPSPGAQKMKEEGSND